MTSGTFDLQTTLLVIGAALAVVILLWLLLRFGRGRQSIRSETTERVEARVDDPYPATKERPYVKPPAAPPAKAPVAGTQLEPAPAPPPPPPPPPTQTSEAGRPLQHDDIGVSQPAVPLPGELAGIAFPPHSTDHPDPLTRLKGVGPKLEALLNEQGITRYEQLASLDADELARLEERLGAFKGRLTRDRVVEQARLLASGDTEEFEARFGKLGG